jgi:exodeoxyribonuclease VII small subunit
VSGSAKTRDASGDGPERDERGRRIADLKVEEALGRLEEIADELEGGDLDLERSLARFREARALYGHCVARLTAAEREVRILMADGSTVAAGADEDLGGEPEGGR